MSPKSSSTASSASPSGPDETTCSNCHQRVKLSLWTCPYCGQIFEGLLLDTLKPKTLSEPERQAYQDGYEECRKRCARHDEVGVPIADYHPSPGFENAYRAGWKQAAGKFESRSGPQRGSAPADRPRDARSRRLLFLSVLAFLIATVSAGWAAWTGRAAASLKSELAATETQCRLAENYWITLETRRPESSPSSLPEDGRPLTEYEKKLKQWETGLKGWEKGFDDWRSRAKVDAQKAVEDCLAHRTALQKQIRAQSIHTHVLYGLAAFMVLAWIGTLLLRNSLDRAKGRNPSSIIDP